MKIDSISRLGALIFIFFFMSEVSLGQSIIVVDGRNVTNPMRTAENCGDLNLSSIYNIQIGETYTFSLFNSAENPCNGSTHFEIERPDGMSEFIEIDSTYTFNLDGEYIIGCLSSPPPTRSSSLQQTNLVGACVTVSAPIPTLGEWGLIILGTMLLILGLVVVRSPEIQIVKVG